MEPASSAILPGFRAQSFLAMIALYVGFEAVVRLFQPIVIHFAEAIPIAVLGLGVNIASARLLSGASGHGHEHGHRHTEVADDVELTASDGTGPQFLSWYRGVALEIQEVGVPPRFRVHFEKTALRANPPVVTIETVRPTWDPQLFLLKSTEDSLE